ncbi:hypothetical protein BH18ACT6_BH18ACT6_14580 [soil metagenome]
MALLPPRALNNSARIYSLQGGQIRAERMGECFCADSSVLYTEQSTQKDPGL